MVHVNFLFSISKNPLSLQLGFNVANLECFPFSLSMFEFSGNPGATGMRDLPQKLELSRDFPTYVNLYLNELGLMGHRVFYVLQPQRKSKTKELGLRR